MNVVLPTMLRQVRECCAIPFKTFDEVIEPSVAHIDDRNNCLNHLVLICATGKFIKSPTVLDGAYGLRPAGRLRGPQRGKANHHYGSQKAEHNYCTQKRNF
ncbi:hypothetical protein ASD58_19800 [Duganella sp. Root1480D1]|nr:hypothetical protein ASD58_19800 [Duganella sp. Root1480D1]